MWIDNLCSRFPDKLQKLDWVAPDPHFWPSSHLWLSSTFWLFTSLQRQTQQKYNSETLKIKRGFWNWANDQDSTWSSPSPVTLQAGSTATRVQRPHSPSPRAWIWGKKQSNKIILDTAQIKKRFAKKMVNTSANLPFFEAALRPSAIRLLLPGTLLKCF